MYNLEEIIDLFVASEIANKEIYNFLKKCKITLLKAKIINQIKMFIHPSVIDDLNKKINYYISELKSDKFDLKTYKKIIDFSSRKGIYEFEYDFAALVECIKLKDMNIGQIVNYYFLELVSMMDGFNYNNPEIVEDKVSIYNDKMNELSLRINNSLDKRE